jgi:hypothetical protein
MNKPMGPGVGGGGGAGPGWGGGKDRRRFLSFRSHKPFPPAPGATPGRLVGYWRLS